jgi:hypothetical protein
MKSAAFSFRRPMKTSQNYHYSNHIDDALAAISQAEGKFAVLAGGIDLLLDIQQERIPRWIMRVA